MQKSLNEMTVQELLSKAIQHVERGELSKAFDYICQSLKRLYKEKG